MALPTPARDIDIARRAMFCPAKIFCFASCALQLVCASVPGATIRSAYIQIADVSDEDSRRSFDSDQSRRSFDSDQSRRSFDSDQSRRSFDSDQSRRSFDSDQRQSFYPTPPPQRSYVIYDGDVSALPNARERPLEGSTRPWHVEFNQRRLGQASQLVPETLAYQSVYSNLIQIYDGPSQRKYYGANDGNAYLEPERGYQNYPMLVPRPLEVPKYEVVYPFENHRKHHYYNSQLPQKFPVPFYPNKNFEFKDPPPVDGSRRNFGLFRTHTKNYPPREIPQDQRESRRGQCNYIQLNEKGFPVGNEMCGRNINEILLAPDYPSTGELVLEHRKRYRGVDRNSGTNEPKRDNMVFSRNRRSAEDISSRFGGGYSSYYSNGGCCGEVVGSGYGYRPYYGYRNDGPEYDYNNVRFMSRPYESERGSYGGYGYRDGGQYDGNNGDDVGEETSDNRGLASYLANRGRGDRGRFKDSEENSDGGGEEGRERDSSNSSDGSNNSKGGNSSGSRENDRGNSQGRKSNNSSRNKNRRNQSSNRNSDRDRSSDSSQSQGNNRSYSNRRNLGSSNSESEDGYSHGSNSGGSNGGSSDGYYTRNGGSNDGYYSRNGGSNDGYYSRNGGNNYGYLRNYDSSPSSGRSYGGSSGYYGGISNLGSGSFGSYGTGNYGRSGSAYGYDG